MGHADLLGGLLGKCGLFPVLQSFGFCFSPSIKKRLSIPLEGCRFVVGLTLLCVSITTLPLFAEQLGWAIRRRYTDIFADLVIVGAVLLVSCKYIKEAFTKFNAILQAKGEDEQ